MSGAGVERGSPWQIQGGHMGPCSVCILRQLLGTPVLLFPGGGTAGPPLTSTSSPDFSQMRQRKRTGRDSPLDCALLWVLAPFSLPPGKVERRHEEAGGRVWSFLQTEHPACSSPGPGGLTTRACGGSRPASPGWGQVCPLHPLDAYQQARVDTHPPGAAPEMEDELRDAHPPEDHPAMPPLAPQVWDTPTRPRAGVSLGSACCSGRWGSWPGGIREGRVRERVPCGAEKCIKAEVGLGGVGVGGITDQLPVRLRVPGGPQSRSGPGKSSHWGCGRPRPAGAVWPHPEPYPPPAFWSALKHAWSG